MTGSWWPVVAVVAGRRRHRRHRDVRRARLADDLGLPRRVAVGQPVPQRRRRSAASTSRAASFLGIAGLVLTYGVDMLWFPVGYTVGYLVLLVLVAAPLRRSGAYTLPDFAEMRLGSRRLRRVVVGPRRPHRLALPAAAAAGRRASPCDALTGAPHVGRRAASSPSSSASPSLAGGMRSITVVQAFQYWLKLVAIALPAVLLVGGLVPPRRARVRRRATGVRRCPGSAAASTRCTRRTRSCSRRSSAPWACRTCSCASTRTRTAGRRGGPRSSVLVLLSVFYLFPPVFGALGRVYTPELAGTTGADTVVLLLPGRVFGGWLGEALSALVAAGAFAAFLSTASGLSVSVAGVLSQDVLAHDRRLGDGVRRFRIATTLAIAVPFVLALGSGRADLAQTVTLAFAVAASTFCPLLVLGIWWPRLTVRGATAGARRRRWHGARRGGARPRVRSVHRLRRGAARAAGRVDRAAGLRHGGRRLAAHARPRAAHDAGRDGAAARARGARRGTLTASATRRGGVAGSRRGSRRARRVGAGRHGVVTPGAHGRHTTGATTTVRRVRTALRRTRHDDDRPSVDG